MTHGLLDPVSGKTQEWIVDCSDNQPAPDLWLENGDVIDVPDKEYLGWRRVVERRL